MNKFIPILFLGLLFSDASGQSIGIYGGINTNRFYDYQTNEAHFYSKYKFDYGYSCSAMIEDIKIDSFPLCFRISYANYKGEIYTTDGGRGGASKTNADVNKDMIGFGIYPLNLTLLKRFKLRFGGEFSFLINDKTNGEKESWLIGYPNNLLSIKNGFPGINKKFNCGIQSILLYNISLKNDWMLVPRYMFYLGLAGEFYDIEANTKAYRNFLEIGIAKNLK